MSEAAHLLALLEERGWTIGLAESLTGGLLTSALVDVPGASASVRGGVVAYATDLKHSLLRVDAALLAEHGPVHPLVAAQLATGVRDLLGRHGQPCEVGLATTGVAGPDPVDGQPVGTVHLGLATPHGTRVESLLLHGDRQAIRSATVEAALALACAAL